MSSPSTALAVRRRRIRLGAFRNRWARYRVAQVANGRRVSQIARNLTDAGKGVLTGKRYIIHDRDPLITAEFPNMITDAGVKPVKVPR